MEILVYICSAQFWGDLEGKRAGLVYNYIYILTFHARFISFDLVIPSHICTTATTFHITLLILYTPQRFLLAIKKRVVSLLFDSSLNFNQIVMFLSFHYVFFSLFYISLIEGLFDHVYCSC